MNEGYTSIEGKVYQKCSVIKLPTNKPITEDSLLFFGGYLIDGCRISVPDNAVTFLNPIDKTFQTISGIDRFEGRYLYFLSSEEIKEGDCIYEVASQKLGKYHYDSAENTHDLVIADKNYPFITPEYFKKVIATTDPALTLNFHDGATNTEINGLPRPSNSFLEAYVREYNKGNIIKEVLVEMEQLCHQTGQPCGFPCNGLENCKKSLYLKVAPDNSITISKIKGEKTYTRNEVIGILIDYRNSIMPVGEKEIVYLNQFVNENLK